MPRAQQHSCDRGPQDYKNWEWDASRFPRPAAFLRDLHQRGVHVVTIIDPGIKADPSWQVYRSGKALDVFVKVCLWAFTVVGDCGVRLFVHASG